jgi:hypothetical protein
VNFRSQTAGSSKEIVRHEQPPLCTGRTAIFRSVTANVRDPLSARCSFISRRRRASAQARPTIRNKPLPAASASFPLGQYRIVRGRNAAHTSGMEPRDRDYFMLREKQELAAAACSCGYVRERHEEFAAAYAMRVACIDRGYARPEPVAAPSAMAAV